MGQVSVQQNSNYTLISIPFFNRSKPWQRIVQRGGGRCSPPSVRGVNNSSARSKFTRVQTREIHTMLVHVAETIMFSLPFLRDNTHAHTHTRGLAGRGTRFIGMKNPPRAIQLFVFFENAQNSLERRQKLERIESFAPGSIVRRAV